ncbi:type II toxin-antitoxin system HicB family antitoxin [Apilactobacillus sp. M161]|uniref:Type II toxin-antitoxin system HicB family antitoxin n=1 Tax=Apilactobacillus xinyiensis TaxID=2841032 RepID=A0ABT0I265_9LACO|nr:type II toxin-antitoxin system HicB family antitoxin [Apilactobacillus xinyiensis]MCK8624805.1 type II toxin-antitoxin system HicB family antitoxin [Apilactobacillus xinyiensis]
MINKSDNFLVYPVILHPELEGGYSVEVPDINGGSWTQGETVEESLYMARDLIGINLIDCIEYPKFTPIKDIKVAKNDIITVVDIDINKYRRSTAKTVRKNVSLPEYLVEIGKKQGINFSDVLTKALEEKLL